MHHGSGKPVSDPVHGPLARGTPLAAAGTDNLLADLRALDDMESGALLRPLLQGHHDDSHHSESHRHRRSTEPGSAVQDNDDGATGTPRWQRQGSSGNGGGDANGAEYQSRRMSVSGSGTEQEGYTGEEEEHQMIDEEDMYTTRELIAEKPKDVVQFLEEEGMQKLGELEVLDSAVFNAFGGEGLLTLGHEHAEPDWEQMWRERLGQAAPSTGTGWTTSVTLEAHVVQITDAAAAGNQGLLHPLLLRHQAKGCPATVFALPAVQAVINFKWTTWARKFLFAELAAYAAWLAAFCTFTLLLVDAPQPDAPSSTVTLLSALLQPGSSVDELSAMDHGSSSGAVLNGLLGQVTGMASTPSSGGGSVGDIVPTSFDPDAWRAGQLLASLASVVCMLPFLYMELCTIWVYGHGWFSLWNLLDLVSYAMQVVIAILHLLRPQLLLEGWVSTLLAIHHVLLWTKLNYYMRVFNPSKTQYSDTIVRVLQDMRYFLLFLVLTMCGFSFAFYSLMRQDREDYVDFKTFWHTFASMFAYMLAMFDTNVLYNSTNPVAAMVLFVVYEFLTAVLLLNIMIAVMTSAFAKVGADEGIRFLVFKAEVIDELESTLPRWIKRKSWYPRFVHLLRVSPHTYEVSLHSVWSGMGLLESNLMGAQQETRARLEVLESELMRANRRLRTALKLLAMGGNSSGRREMLQHDTSRLSEEALALAEDDGEDDDGEALYRKSGSFQRRSRSGSSSFRRQTSHGYKSGSPRKLAWTGVDDSGMSSAAESGAEYYSRSGRRRSGRSSAVRALRESSPFLADPEQSGGSGNNAGQYANDGHQANGQNGHARADNGSRSPRSSLGKGGSMGSLGRRSAPAGIGLGSSTEIGSMGDSRQGSGGGDVGGRSGGSSVRASLDGGSASDALWRALAPVEEEGEGEVTPSKHSKQGKHMGSGLGGRGASAGGEADSVKYVGGSSGVEGARSPQPKHTAEKVPAAPVASRFVETKHKVDVQPSEAGLGPGESPRQVKAAGTRKAPVVPPASPNNGQAPTSPATSVAAAPASGSLSPAATPAKSPGPAAGASLKANSVQLASQSATGLGGISHLVAAAAAAATSLSSPTAASGLRPSSTSQVGALGGRNTGTATAAAASGQQPVPGMMKSASFSGSIPTGGLRAGSSASGGATAGATVAGGASAGRASPGLPPSTAAGAGSGQGLGLGHHMSGDAFHVSPAASMPGMRARALSSTGSTAGQPTGLMSSSSFTGGGGVPGNTPTIVPYPAGTVHATATRPAPFMPVVLPSTAAKLISSSQSLQSSSSMISLSGASGESGEKNDAPKTGPGLDGPIGQIMGGPLAAGLTGMPTMVTVGQPRGLTHSLSMGGGGSGGGARPALGGGGAVFGTLPPRGPAQAQASLNLPRMTGLLPASAAAANAAAAAARGQQPGSATNAGGGVRSHQQLPPKP